MSLLDRYNKFAKKRLYINHDFQLGIGRLIFILIITGIEAIGMLLVGAGAGIPSLVLNAILALEKREKEKEPDVVTTQPG